MEFVAGDYVFYREKGKLSWEGDVIACWFVPQ